MDEIIETVEPTSGEQPDSETAVFAPTKRRFNLSIRELPLKQAPMEAVIKRET